MSYAVLTEPEFGVIMERVEQLAEELKLSHPALGSAGLGVFMVAARAEGMSLANILEHVEYTYDAHARAKAALEN